MDARRGIEKNGIVGLRKAAVTVGRSVLVERNEGDLGTY